MHDRLLTEAIAAHRGTVVKSTGDGIMATFSGAADAVSAAVAMQQAVEAHGRRSPGAPLAVRIGISLGDVTWEGNDCFGVPVIEAARLCATAEGGQILVADLVRLTARGRGGHRFTPIGPVVLKGLSEPVVAWAVAWERVAETGIPLPPRIASRPAFAMFGRSEEPAALEAAWAKAKDGQRQVVLLAGEPGIRKTRLAMETRRAAHAEGGTVLFGTCDEDVGMPYRPWVEALRHYVAHASEDALTAHAASHGGELTRIVPELARRVPDLPAPQKAEAETERYLLFEAVTGLLSAASQESPILLILDDLQWAGMPELLLLKHMIRVAASMRLLVVSTYRDTDLMRTHPLTAVLADLRREDCVQRLSLQGLDDAAVETLVRAATRHELDEARISLAHAIRRETEGNPFFIGEVIRHLSESGAFFQEAERWKYRGTIEGLGIPEGVREVIGRRLSRLSKATNRILSLGAVIGRQFDVTLLSRVAETSEDAVLDALDEATTAALIREVTGGQFTFRHALIRTTLYEELSATRRARLHRRFGEVLEDLAQGQLEARVEELAHHWLAATEAVDAAKAVSYARQAAERALAGLAFEEAAAYYERALAVWTPQDRAGQVLRCDLLIGLGDAQRRAGDTQYRATVQQPVDAARALGDGERLARAVLTTARPGGFNASSDVIDRELIALYEEAAAALGDGDSLLRARVLGQLAVELLHTHEQERRDTLTREAVEIARRVGDRVGLAQVLVLRIVAIRNPFTLAERLTLLEELSSLAEALRNRELAWHTAFHRAGALLESGDVAGAEQAIGELERLAAELRQPFYGWYARVGVAMLAGLRGDPDTERLAIAAFEFGVAGGQPEAATALGGQLFHHRLNQGRLGELIDGLRAQVERAPDVQTWRVVLARALTETNRLDEAREQLAILGRGGFEQPINWLWPPYMVVLSHVVADLKDRAASAILYERLRPIATLVSKQAGMLTCGGSYGTYCGKLATCRGRWEEAEAHFTDALAPNERIGARPHAVRTRRCWAEMLLERDAPGDRERAAQLIAAGRSEAEQLGMARELELFERLTKSMKSATAA